MIGSLSFEVKMKIAFILIMALFPTMLFGASHQHQIRLVLNVVNEADGVVTLQDTHIGKMMFNRFMEGDKNLVFLTDIGFKYIKSIIVDMSNDTTKRTQTVVVRTVGDRIIIKEIPFFVYSEPQLARYVFTQDRFMVNKFDRGTYYLAAYSN